jgi:FkbM family methyltransferase
MLTSALQKIFHVAGVQIKRFPDVAIRRRLKLMKTCDINVIFDIGANIGQTGIHFREYGYTGKIVSFEPLNDAYAQLLKASKGDQKWETRNCAIGNADTTTKINISGNSVSSSLLDMLPTHENSAPESKYVGQQEILVKKIDTVFPEIVGASDNVMLKIDTQGFEKMVIDGAKSSLDQIKIVQLEVSLVPLYKDELLLTEMIQFMDKMNFQLFSLEDAYEDSITGQLMQVDCVFANKNLTK